MRTSARIAIVLLAAGIIAPVVSVSEPANSASAATTPVAWVSGSSGDGAVSGQFGSWRGRDVGIAGTWADDEMNSVNFWQLQKGGDFSSWDKPIDIAVGAFDEGGSWSAAASGAYDARWTRSLTQLKSLRSGTIASTYIRFAHEMNGNWYPWQVNSANYTSFVASWKRYRTIQLKVFPAAKLTFNVSRESIGTGMDWRKFFPGKAYVDTLSVDYYNQYPYVSTSTQWASSLNDVDAWGGPKGLAQHLAFAKGQNLPFAISEWAEHATFGDSPAFVTGLLGYVKANAGYGAGQIRYEIYFNVVGYNGDFALTGASTRLPKSAAAYRTFFQNPTNSLRK